MSAIGRGGGKKAAEEVDAVMETTCLLPPKTLAKESRLTKKTVVVDVASKTSFEVSFFL